MTCKRTEQLDAYHDGELDRAAASEVARHIAGCESCQAELAEMVRLRAAFHDLPDEAPSADLWRRAHVIAEEASTEARWRILRIGVSLSGLAASILIVVATWSATDDAPTNHPIEVATGPAWTEWERVAMTLRTDRQPVESTVGDPTQMLADASMNDARMADWMIRGLSQ